MDESETAVFELREKVAPVIPRVVSLFSGAGGLDFGFSQEGFPLAFASDIMPAAMDTHRRNFPGVPSWTGDITERNAATGRLVVVEKLELELHPGEPIGIIGGPPCQGFSRANVNSRHDDPRNELPRYYLEVVAELQANYSVEFVLFENVMGIRDRKHAATFSSILAELEQLGFRSDVSTYSALDYGVPQTRNRVIIAAFADDDRLSKFNPRGSEANGDLTVRGAIGHLPQPTFFRHGLKPEDVAFHPNHWTMMPRSKRFSHEAEAPSKARSFRRLDWNKPSPTVAYGHREIHVHPDGRRRLSILEAMLLQGFPQTFEIRGNLSQQVQQVSNAVPPPVARSLAAAVKASLSSADVAVSSHWT